ncbi:MAG: YbaB/EbfC family nucleoid-associated protein [Chloroflexi bacterium]|nr:YbaB/EbfC family nucleoid-associated protein [Chloroflexota bacterium]MDA1218082.1 YbaB/EbfC family nucleoid-associated protein [Chloroflexota bacterium]PKB57919.1 MAG: nucleoid-associated protein [SAR202 cluster bacterium Casp-Chloro-G3]
MNKNMIRQAQKLQAQLQKVQEELETLTVIGTAGGGVVKVVMTGKQSVESVTIDPEAAEDVELLQDLVAAAVNDAFNKTQELASQKMSSVTGGMNIPGLGF